jgi:hypothetical protein
MRAYLSHPIRGAKGAAATHEDIEANNRRAIEFAARVRAEFPGLDLYVPAEHDELVQESLEQGILTTEQILQIDRYLLARRDILIVFSPDSYIGGGVRVEIEEAQRLRKPIAFTTGSMDPIHGVLESILHG